jgi:guanylate kinase
MPHGHLNIVAGPSGSGKSTLIKRFLKEYPQYCFPTSVTTREPRKGEIDGDHYFFVSRDEFRAKREQNQFLEWAAVYGLYYGTLKSTITEGLANGRLFLKDIDIQGAKSLMNLVKPTDLTSIFISPPSLDELKARLLSRGTETEQTLRNRLAEAEVEMQGIQCFQHVIVNDNFEQSYTEFKRCVLASV